MPSRLAVIVTVAALLSGCSKASEQAMNDSYDKNFMASCVPAASKGAMTPAMAQQACKCTVDGINKQYSAVEKLTVSDEKLKPIMLGCLNTVVKQ